MKKLGFIIVLALFLGNTGCDVINGSQPEGSVPPPTTVKFELENNSIYETHMWITGETIGPNNKLATGSHNSRVAIYTKSDALMKDFTVSEDIVTVYAGRNGNVIASKTYSVTTKTVGFTSIFKGGSIK